MLDITNEIEDSLPSKQFNITLNAYEGPIDLLLELARKQKVDLSEISILELAEQYINFINQFQDIHLEIAADYLVMAAWLAYLKSILLLPKTETGEELSAEEMADRLKLQLKKLEAIRIVSKKLMDLPKLGQDFFARGMPEGIRLIRTPNYYLSFYDLLKSYADQRYKTAYSKMTIERPAVYAMEDALVRLQRLIGEVPQWTKLENFLPPEFAEGNPARTGVAGTLAAAMELAREGVLEVQQLIPFGPVFFKNKSTDEKMIN